MACQFLLWIFTAEFSAFNTAGVKSAVNPQHNLYVTHGFCCGFVAKSMVGVDLSYQSRLCIKSDDIMFDV